MTVEMGRNHEMACNFHMDVLLMVAPLSGMLLLDFTAGDSVRTGPIAIILRVAAGLYSDNTRGKKE